MKCCFDEHPAHFGALFGYCDHQVHKLMGRMLRRYDVSPMQRRASGSMTIFRPGCTR